MHEKVTVRGLGGALFEVFPGKLGIVVGIEGTQGALLVEPLPAQGFLGVFVLGEPCAEDDGKNHQAEGCDRVLFVVIMILPMVVIVPMAVIVLMAVIVATAHPAVGVDEVEKAQDNHGQAANESDEVEGRSEVFENSPARIEVDRDNPPGDGREAGDDLVQGGLLHGEEWTYCSMSWGSGGAFFLSKNGSTEMLTAPIVTKSARARKKMNLRVRMVL